MAKSRVKTIARQLAQGATFGAGDELMDVVAAGVAAGLTDAEFKDLFKEARQSSVKELAQDYKDYPVSSIASNLAGGILTGGTGPFKAAYNWAGAGNTLGQLLKTGALNIGLGGTAGYASGSGDDRGSSAAAGAVIGGLLTPVGVAVNKLMPQKAPIQKAAQATQKKLKGNKAEEFFVKQLASRPDLAKSAQEATRLQNAARQQGINLTTPEMMSFGPTDPLLAQQGIVSGNPQTGGRMAQFYQNRSGQIEDAYSRLAGTLSPAQSYDEAADLVIGKAKNAGKSITRELSGKAGPLYDEAFKANRSIGSKTIDKILATPEGQTAVAEARRNMQNEMSLMAFPDPDLTEAMRSLESVGKMDYQEGGVAAGLRLQSLDYVKRAFDDTIRKAMRSGDMGEVRRIENLRSGLVKELDKLDITGIAGPNSLKAEGGKYAQARGVYSGSPEKLQMRQYIGNLADVDPLQSKEVASNLMQGTQRNANLTARALSMPNETIGPQSPFDAGAAVIRNALETNRGAPESIVRKLAPNDRTAEQLSAYLGPQASGQMSDINELSRRVLMGNRLVKAPSPTQERTAAEKLMQGAEMGRDVVSGNVGGVVSKIANMFGRGSQAEDPQFYDDLYRLMTTDEGMNLVNRIANTQAPALQKATTAVTPIKAGPLMVERPMSVLRGGTPTAAVTAPITSQAQSTPLEITVRPSDAAGGNEAEKERLLNELRKEYLIEQLRAQ